MLNKKFKDLQESNRKIKNCVYCAYNIVNHKVYIGYTETSLERRISSHKHKSKCSNKAYFHLSLYKHGVDNFKWFVLFQGSTLEELQNKEIYFINLYKSNNRKFGYNLSTGGERCYLNEEVKRKIGEKAKARNISGINNPFFGKKHTEETKKKLSEIRKGKVWNPGYKHSKEVKIKLSNIRKELLKNPEVIEKMRLAQKGKPIICLETNIKYKSIAEASRLMNIPVSGIKNQINGRSKTTMGYKFEFIKND